MDVTGEEQRAALALGSRPRLIGLAGAVALGTGFALISPPAAEASVGVTPAAAVPAAFRSTPAVPPRVAEVVLVIPATAAAPGRGTPLPPPVGSDQPALPHMVQPVLLVSAAPSPLQPVGAVTDASGGAGLPGVDQQTLGPPQQMSGPGVTAPAGSVLAPASAGPADAPLVLADSSQPGGAPAGGPPAAAPAQAPAAPVQAQLFQTLPVQAPAATTGLTGPLLTTGVGQAAGCIYLYCGTGAVTSDGRGNYNYLVGAGVNLTGRPYTGSITSGQQDLFVPNMSSTMTAGLLGTYSWSSGPLSVRATGQMEIPVEQIPTAIANASGALGQLAMWAFPDYFPPLNPTINVGGTVTVKGSAVLSQFPVLAPIVPQSVSNFLDRFQVSKGGYVTYNSETGEFNTRTVNGEKLQIVGSDGYLVGFVKVPSQTSPADLAEQAGGLLFGSPAQPATVTDPSQQTPDNAGQQPAAAPTGQAAPTDASQQPAAAGQQTPDNAGQQPAATSAGQATPTDPGQQPGSTNQQTQAGTSQQPASTGQQTPGDVRQQPAVAPTGQAAPTDAGQQAPAETGQQSPAPVGAATSSDTSQQAGPTGQQAPAAVTGETIPSDTGQQAAPTGQQPPADTGQQPPADTGQQPPADTGQQPAAAPVGQAAPGDTSQQAAPGDTSQQAAPADQQTAADTGQPAAFGQATPTDTGQAAAADTSQPAAAADQQTATDTAQQPAAAQASPSDASQQPGPTSQQTSTSTGQQPPAPVGEAVPTGQGSAADGQQPGSVTGLDAGIGSANDQGSEPGPSPIGAGLPSTGLNSGVTLGGRSPANSSSPSARAGSTTSGGTGSGTTSPSGGTSSGANWGSSTSSALGSTSSGGTSYAGMSSGGASYAGTSSASYGGTSSASYGATSSGGTSSGGASYAGTSSGGTSTGGTTSGGSTSSGGS